VLVGDSGRLGWWLVDPATGGTLDLLDDGRGTDVAEYVLVGVLWGLLASAVILALGVCVRDAYLGVTSFMAAQKEATGMDIWGVGDVPIRYFSCRGS
jgi:hypothetical protein